MVYIVVLNWSNAADTISCLESLLSIDKVPFRIIVCDNSSPDGSYYKIKEWLQSQATGYMAGHHLVELDIITATEYSIPDEEVGVYLIQTGQNLGFSGGNNVGIKFALNQSSCDYVWVLNNDTIVQANTLVSVMLFLNQQKMVGVCGSVMVHMDQANIVQSIGGRYNRIIMTTTNVGEGVCVEELHNFDAISSIDYVIGASMLFPAEVLRKVGLLCEDYFLYYEEIDICNRIRKAGYKVVVCPDFIVRHKGGASTSGGKSNIADYCSVRNRLLIARKFHPRSLVFVWFSMWLIFCNRMRRCDFYKAKNVLRIICGKRGIDKALFRNE